MTARGWNGVKDGAMNDSEPLAPGAGSLETMASGDVSMDPGGIASLERALTERLLRVHESDAGWPEVNGNLLFWVGGVRYSGALQALREALPAIPCVTPLPFSPPWLLGLFPLRTELVSLIDPQLFLRDVAATGGAIEAETRLNGKQALLIGESGRMIALVVDRFGDIVSAATSPELPDSAPEALVVLNADVARHTGIEGGEMTQELDLAALYVDVIAKLEAWARDV